MFNVVINVSPFYFRPDLPRPIKVNLALPIIFIVCCVTLVMIPTFTEPMNLIVGVLITLSGVPIYYVCVVWKSKPKKYIAITQGIERFCQILFDAVFMDVEQNV